MARKHGFFRSHLGIRFPRVASSTLREAVSYSAEAVALFARFTTPPTAARKQIVETLIVALKNAGVWTKLDALYVMAAADEQAARRNWVADQYNLTEANAPTFTADQGYAGNGTTSYLDTGFNPVTAVSPKFLLNDASFGLWSRTSGMSGVSAAGWTDGTGDGVTISPRSNSDAFNYRINQASSTGTANTDGVGLYVASRSGANATQGYKNGAAIGSAGAQASAPLNSATFNFGHATAATYSTMQFAAGLVGGNLSAAENTALYAALSTYLTAVGAQ